MLVAQAGGLNDLLCFSEMQVHNLQVPIGKMAETATNWLAASTVCIKTHVSNPQ